MPPTPVKFGFTGTRNGMTVVQRKAFRQLLRVWIVEEFHHGDCVGADMEAHQDVFAIKPKAKIIIHPPSNLAARAWRKGDVLLPSKPFLERNKDIVKDCEFLVACPGEKEERLRSGTWATVRFARKFGRGMILVFPDGSTRYA